MSHHAGALGSAAAQVAAVRDDPAGRLALMHRRGRGVVSGAARDPEVERLVAAYRADLVAAGVFAEHPVTSPARSFLARVGVERWSRLSLAEQCATSLKNRRVVGWLMVTGRLQPSPDFLVLGRPYLGEVAARHRRTSTQPLRRLPATRTGRHCTPAPPRSPGRNPGFGSIRPGWRSRRAHGRRRPAR